MAWTLRRFAFALFHFSMAWRFGVHHPAFAFSSWLPIGFSKELSFVLSHLQSLAFCRFVACVALGLCGSRLVGSERSKFLERRIGFSNGAIFRRPARMGHVACFAVLASYFHNLLFRHYQNRGGDAQKKS